MTKVTISIFLFVLVLIFILILYGIGMVLPKKREAQRTVEFDASVEHIWGIVTDMEAQIYWRPSLKGVKVREHYDDVETWIEYPLKGPAIYFKTAVKEAPSRFEFEMTDGKTWKGHWVGEFISLPNRKTKIIFTECLEIGNPFIRVLSYLFFDLGATMDRYLIELSAKLGEKYQKDDFLQARA